MTEFGKHVFWLKYRPDWHELHVTKSEYVAHPKIVFRGNLMHDPLDKKNPGMQRAQMLNAVYVAQLVTVTAWQMLSPIHLVDG